MAAKVRTIPATLNRFSSEPVASPKKKRVAGYARVSTDLEEQVTSYEAQMSYYKNYIESRPDWEFVGMYSDEGISATNTKHRDGFNKMIEDALAGKIDLIITKSVSRFARNTVDSLQNVRKLKEKGIEIYFEKENIWTLDAKGELLITIMSSLAQEESRSISENTTWGKRKQFADGKCAIGYSTFLGYDKDFKINKEQAKVVKLIYKLFISGNSLYAIKKELERRGIKSPAGKPTWSISTLKSILTNEKYKGDALLQKGYTSDFLQKTRKKNKGEIPQYYVQGHHEAIIPPKQFDFVQIEYKRRRAMKRYSGVSIYSCKIKCGCCGGWYGQKIWHSNEDYRKYVYVCNSKYKKDHEKCVTPAVTKEQINEAFINALNSMIDEKAAVIENMQMLIDSVCRTDALEKECKEIEDDLDSIASDLNKMISKNARTVQDQNEYREKENQLRNAYCEKQNRKAEIEGEIFEKKNRREMLKSSIEIFSGVDGRITEFDQELWEGLVDYVRIEKDGKITVVFQGKIEVSI